MRSDRTAPLVTKPQWSALLHQGRHACPDAKRTGLSHKGRTKKGARLKRTGLSHKGRTKKGARLRANTVFLSLRLCARLYWRRVAFCTNAAWCVTDGVEPLTQLRLTSALVSLRNPLPQGERGPLGSPAGREFWCGFAVAGPPLTPPPCFAWSPSPCRGGLISLSPTLARDNARCSSPRPWRLAPACLRRQSRRP